MSGIIISMPEEDRQEFLGAMESIQAQAEAFTAECVKLLVERHGAVEAEIEQDIFLHNAVGRLVQGQALGEPAERVREALRLYKAKYLGLAWEEE